MRLVDEIKTLWQETANGYCVELTGTRELGYTSWVVKMKGGYGVAIPIEAETQISERFANARLFTDSIRFADGSVKDALFLHTSSHEIQDPFASLCSEFVYPGEDGCFRRELEQNPVGWWAQWKELLGNKNVDERVYDVLGELLTLIHLLEIGKQPHWQGPDAATYDIGADNELFEVKSSIKRKAKEITLSNRFQLQPPEGKKLWLYYCQFERATKGYSIDSAVLKLGELGMNTNAINDKLDRMGLEVGKSARKREYMLHEMTEYCVDDSFPAIRETSFVGGQKPLGVTNYTYTVSLDSVKGKQIDFG